MRYMLLIYGPDMQPGQSEAAGMEDIAPWLEYGQWLTERGWFRAGEPLAPTATATSVRVREGSRLVTDGPFAETKEVLGGYYIIECANLDEALEAASRCPGASIGTMEVRPLVDRPPDAGADPATAVDAQRSGAAG